MRYSKELNQALKISLVYVVITFFFRLLQKLSSLLFIRSNRDNFMNFIKMNFIWFIVMSVIVAVLCIYIRIKDGEFHHSFMNDPFIRLTSGLLLLFEGIMNVSVSLPVAVSNILMLHQFASEFENSIGTSQKAILISNVIPSLVNLLQLLFGLYLILHKPTSNKTENNL